MGDRQISIKLLQMCNNHTEIGEERGEREGGERKKRTNPGNF